MAGISIFKFGMVCWCNEPQTEEDRENSIICGERPVVVIQQVPISLKKVTVMPLGCTRLANMKESGSFRITEHCKSYVKPFDIRPVPLKYLRPLGMLSDGDICVLREIIAQYFGITAQHDVLPERAHFFERFLQVSNTRAAEFNWDTVVTRATFSNKERQAEPEEKERQAEPEGLVIEIPKSVEIKVPDVPEVIEGLEKIAAGTQAFAKKVAADIILPKALIERKLHEDSAEPEAIAELGKISLSEAKDIASKASKETVSKNLITKTISGYTPEQILGYCNVDKEELSRLDMKERKNILQLQKACQCIIDNDLVIVPFSYLNTRSKLDFDTYWQKAYDYAVAMKIG